MCRNDIIVKAISFLLKAHFPQKFTKGESSVLNIFTHHSMCKVLFLKSGTEKVKWSKSHVGLLLGGKDWRPSCVVF